MCSGVSVIRQTFRDFLSRWGEKIEGREEAWLTAKGTDAHTHQCNRRDRGMDETVWDRVSEEEDVG